MGPPPCLLGGRMPPSSSLFLSLPDPGSFYNTKGEAPRTHQKPDKSSLKESARFIPMEARFTLGRETNQVEGAWPLSIFILTDGPCLCPTHRLKTLQRPRVLWHLSLFSGLPCSKQALKRYIGINLYILLEALNLTFYKRLSHDAHTHSNLRS